MIKTLLMSGVGYSLLGIGMFMLCGMRAVESAETGHVTGQVGYCDWPNHLQQLKDGEYKSLEEWALALYTPTLSERIQKTQVTLTGKDFKRTVKPDAEGNFSFHDVPLGNYKLSARLKDCPTGIKGRLRDAVDEEDITLYRSGETVKRNLLLENGRLTVRGRVVNRHRQGVSGQRVLLDDFEKEEAIMNDRGFWCRSTVTDEKGYYEFVNLPSVDWFKGLPLFLKCGRQNEVLPGGLGAVGIEAVPSGVIDQGHLPAYYTNKVDAVLVYLLTDESLALARQLLAMHCDVCKKNNNAKEIITEATDCSTIPVYTGVIISVPDLRVDTP